LLRRRIPFHVWYLSATMALAFVCSLLAAILGGHRVLAGLTVMFAASGLVTWLVTAVRYSKHALEAGARYQRSVRTCYSLAAVMCHAKHTMSELRDETLETIRGFSANWSDLADAICRLEKAHRSYGLPADVDSGTLSERPVRPQARSDDPSGTSSLLEEVVSTNDRMAQVLTQVNHDAKELVASIEETAYSMSRLDSFLQDMTRSGKDLETSTETANRVALEGTKVVTELGRENEAIIVSVKEAGAAVDNLGRWSEEVGKIVEVIQDITDETNLLALNAAIIAAQSGEHGKAFGVVAEEIRGLAERTSSSTKEINDLVKSVQRNVANVAQSMKKSLQSLEKGDLLAHDAGSVLEKVFESFESSRSLAKEIAASTFERRIDSSCVVKSIHKLTDIARRLESDQMSDLNTNRSSMMTARVASALATRSAAPRAIQAREAGETAGQGLGACSVGVAESDETVIRMIDNAQANLGKAKFALDSIAQKVVMCTRAVEKAADLTRAIVRETPSAPEGIAGRCWEIVGCGQGLRDRCGAYKRGDWRCFLEDEVACGLDKDSEVHGARRCYDCPAFRSNLERLLG